MSTFEIVKYRDTKPDLKLNLTGQGRSKTYMGHMGTDGSFALQHILDWAKEHDLVQQGDLHELLSDFFKFAKEKYFHSDQDSIHIVVRFQTSNDEFKIPRPHHDGWFWSTDLNKGREQYKVGTCFVGPGTLFWSTEGMNEDKTKEVQRIGRIDSHEHAERAGQEIPAEYRTAREWQNDKLKRLQVPTVVPNNCECVRWVMGDADRAAIHSEPDMSDMPEGRLFVMLLPGTEAQVRDLATS
ncbi:hypothetical protein P389DRAFT_172599, partial [Cystobasidium minutum MCA 4210]|uniref:uncharacterized protein n=1 Tax=Cystobasidium minutum MCA 4210 TaxID=1397322 RepID=UPI0034CDFC42|eukprot:jgi/Rhomi1/172599/fgenesh1_kg.5_\